MDPNQYPYQPNQEPPQPAPQSYPAQAGNPQQPQVPNQFTPQQYDFIMGDKPKPKKIPFTIPSSHSGKKQRIIFAALVSFVVLIIATLAFSLFNSSGKGNIDTMVSLAAEQTEIMRVAKLGSRKAGGPIAKNLAHTTDLTITSQRQVLINYLQANKKKIGNNELNQQKNSKIDTQLATAETNGRFDETFIQVIRDSLTAYQSHLKTAHGSSGATGQAILNDNYNQVTTLIESANAAR